ncbi:helix-turn-helix domain-containing protein [Agrobacterium fabrum]
MAKTLDVTPQAARRIVLELGLREMTGRFSCRPGWWPRRSM